MKNSFFSLLFASCLGTLLALGVLILIGVVSISSLAAAFGDEEVSVEANSVLVLDPALVPELTNNLQRDPFALESDDVVGLRSITRALAKAADDDDVKGVVLKPTLSGVPPATAKALRAALLSFRESGKFVLSHAKYYTQSQYYVASAGDAVYVNPTGGIDARGYGATLPYFKGALDKLGVKMDVFYAGDFKSAGEPFFRTSISDSNRLQTREYLDDLWDIWLRDVAAARGMEYGELERLTEQYLVRNDRDAVKYGLVDALYYRDQFRDELRERLGLDDDDEIATVSISDYASTLPKLNLTSKERIAVLYAEGNIVDGPGAPGSIGDRKYVDVIRELREDDRVKGIVLRVNSGGGSAMASENIWRELMLAREQGIKVVTSMGDYAASGGYYIAAGTDTIFAQPNTITGSIGVVALVPNVADLMEDKLGVRFDTVNTGEYSTAFTPVLPWSESDREIFQQGVDEIYETFIDRVATGRGMSTERVKRLAKGRVYSGRDALELNLVDRIGDLDDAIASVARLADLDLDDVRVVEYPKVKDPMQQLVEELTGQGDDDGDRVTLSERFLARELGEPYRQFRELQALGASRFPQAVLVERPSFR